MPETEWITFLFVGCIVVLVVTGEIQAHKIEQDIKTLIDELKGRRS